MLSINPDIQVEKAAPAIMRVDDIAVNRRAAAASLSGVQRYVAELTARLGPITNLEPVNPLFGVRGHLWEQFRLPRLLKSKLLWSPANSGPLCVERQVVTIHDVAVLDHPEWFKSQFVRWYRWMLPRLVRRVRRVIVVSEFTKRRLLDLTKIGGLSIAVIPNGVDRRFYPRPQPEVDQIRNRFGIPTRYYLLSVATIEPRKNLKRELEGWSRCVGQVPDDVWFVVVGVKGKDRVFRQAQIGMLPPRVIMLGFVPDDLLPALYSGALGLIYASLYEGFGLPALESMACGTVPVVSGGTAVGDLVGDCGLLVHSTDVGSIANAITHLISDEAMRKRLSTSAYERSASFSWDRTAEMTRKVLTEAAL